MKKKILVTGGAGFIGSFIVDSLVKKGNEVTIYDNLEPQIHHDRLPEYLNTKARFVKGDVRDYGVLKKYIIESDIIVNFAARVGVGQSMYEVKEYITTNEVGTANIMHAIANEKHSVKKIIVASSMSIYGDGSYYCGKCKKEVYNVERTQEQLSHQKWEMYCPDCSSILTPIPTKETKPINSGSVYAISKKNQEELTLNVGKAYGVPGVALRLWNTYGPRQSLSNPYTGVAAIFMSRIKNNNPPMIFEDGLQSRDFVSVYDVVQAVELSIEKEAADNESFNVGSGEKITINDVAQTLLDIFGSKLKPVANLKYRTGDVRHCFADISKIKSRLGYRPKMNLKKGMEELVEWSRTQEAKDMVNSAFEELKQKKLV
jgi:dTDP-L-rhamnose 4-epimerase